MENSPKSLKDLLVGRENYFDLIRLMAAILVIFSHAYPLSGSAYEDPLYRLTNGQVTLGNLSVFVFFIISGLLITQSYLYSNNLLTYLKSRILRIFPALIGVLLFSAFILGPVVTTLSFKEYITNYGVIQYLKAVFLYPMQWSLPGVFEANAYKDVVNGSLWTIPFEFLCYLIIGVAGFLGLLKHRYLMLLVSVGVFYYYLFSSVIAPSGNGHFLGLEVNTIVELLVFFLMGSLACLFKDKMFLKKEIAMIGIIVLFISIYYGGFKPLFALFGTYIILYFSLLPKSKLSFLTKKGDFSYGIYLYAFPIQQTVTYICGGRTSVWLNFIVSLPVTCVLAVISWYAIEKPSLKYKKVKLTRHFQFEAVNRFTGIYHRLVKSILNMNWAKFIVLFTLFIFVFINYNSKPTVIEFPYQKSESIFSDGWLPQNSNEKYRWITNRASVELEMPTKGTLIIEGFVPETFVEINKISVYINNNKINESEIQAGEGFFLNLPFQSNTNGNLVTIEFNDVHIPSPNDADQRIMSALISKIQVTK